MRNSRLIRHVVMAALLGVSAAVTAQVLKGSMPQVVPMGKTESEINSSLAASTQTIKLGARGKTPSASTLAILRQQSERLRTTGGSLNGDLQPQHTMDFGNPPALPSVNRNVPQVTCPAPSISSVNGQRAGVIFSPIEPYNSYTIQGCFTGDVPKAVYLRAANSFSRNQLSGSQTLIPATRPRISLGSGPDCTPGATLGLVVDFPGSNAKHQPPSQADPRKRIDVHVPPCISGAFDQNGNSVTVVVEYANGQKAELGGFNFFAARETVDLAVVPQSHVKLGGGTIIVAGDNSTIYKYVSPAQKFSALMVRRAKAVQNTRELNAGGKFPPGLDTYDLNGMQPGFAVLEPQLKPMMLTAQVCQKEFGTTNMQAGRQGTWGISWGNDPLTFSIAYAQEFCQPTGPLGLGSAGPAALYEASYAITIPVEGPRGVAPWPMERSN